MIQVFRPTLGVEELAAVGEVFASNWIGHGPRTKAFEAAFAERGAPIRARLVEVCAGILAAAGSCA